MYFGVTDKTSEYYRENFYQRKTASEPADNAEFSEIISAKEAQREEGVESADERRAGEAEQADERRQAIEDSINKRRLQQYVNNSNKSDTNGYKVNNRAYKVYMQTDDMLFSGGNGTGLSFYIKYAEDSTKDDPTVIAKGVDENGKEFEQTIHINQINPQYATVVEMRALEAHLGVDKNGGLSSLPLESGNMGLNERRNFIDMFQKQIKDLMILKQQKTAEYYRYSMQIYWDFMSRK